MERIKNIFINLNKTDLKIMKYGLLFSSIISIIGTLLLTYNLLLVHTFILYKIGISIIKSGFYFSIDFIICGIIADRILKDTVRF